MFPGHSVYSFFSPESGHIRRILPLENFWQTRRTLFRSCICRQHKACCYFLNAFVIVRCPYCSPLTSSVYRGVFLHSSEQYRELLFLLWKSFPQIIHFSTILSPLFKKKAEPESQPGPQCRMASGNSVVYSILKKNCNYNRLQESLIDDLVICPMDIQGFAVNHEFGHFWKVFRNFPVYVIPGKSRYGLS